MMKRILWLLRIPESILAFLGGAFISYSINVFTNSESFKNQKAAAICFLIASILLVLWALIAKPIDEVYQKRPTEVDQFTAWSDALKSKKKNKILLIFNSILTLGVIIVGFLFLWIPGLL